MRKTERKGNVPDYVHGTFTLASTDILNYCREGDYDEYLEWCRDSDMVIDVAGGWACEVDWAHELADEARRRGLPVTVESCDLDEEDGNGDGVPLKGDPEGRCFVYGKNTYGLRDEYKCPRGERHATWPEEMTACRRNAGRSGAVGKNTR